jgi:protocatechuate 3,4-dioxygenase beta subunit
MDSDDLPIGRILDRREAVKLLALTGAAVLVGCDRSAASAADTSALASNAAGAGAQASLPGCIVRPELTVGPYFVDNQLERSDIRTDPGTGNASPGKQLDLTFNVSQVSGGKCVPLAGAMVDVWHCDAAGQYSAVNDQMEGFNTVSQKFLRGFQLTDANGVARFTTIYPGWYRGRTVHIHFKIRAPFAAGASVADAGKKYDFTSQLFFDDALSDRVFTQAPYASKGQRDRRNSNDGIFRQSGDSLLLKVADNGSAYTSTFDIGLDLSDTKVGAEEQGGPGGPPGPRS